MSLGQVRISTAVVVAAGLVLCSALPVGWPLLLPPHHRQWRQSVRTLCAFHRARATAPDSTPLVRSGCGQHAEARARVPIPSLYSSACTMPAKMVVCAVLARLQWRGAARPVEAYPEGPTLSFAYHSSDRWSTRGMPRAPDPGARNESARRGRFCGPMGRNGASPLLPPTHPR